MFLDQNYKQRLYFSVNKRATGYPATHSNALHLKLGVMHYQDVNSCKGYNCCCQQPAVLNGLWTVWMEVLYESQQRKRLQHPTETKTFEFLTKNFISKLLLLYDDALKKQQKSKTGIRFYKRFPDGNH